MRRQRESQQKNQRRLASSSSTSSLFDVQEDEEEPMDSTPVAGGKRKSPHEDFPFYSSRQISSSSSSSVSISPCSSFSDLSSEGRVPSLSWSESSDERPYKRSRYGLGSTTWSSSVLIDIPFFRSSLSSEASTPSPISEFPNSFEYPLILDTSFPMNPNDTIIETSSRGQKRRYDIPDSDLTPRAKRVKPADGGSMEPTESLQLQLPSFPTSSSTTPTQITRRRSSAMTINFESLRGLATAEPAPVQIIAPDPSLPVEFGLFDWDNADMAAGSLNDTGAETQTDFYNLFQLMEQQPMLAFPPVNNQQTTSGQEDEALLEMSLDLDLTYQQSQMQETSVPDMDQLQVQLPHSSSLDMNGLFDSFMTTEALKTMDAPGVNPGLCTPQVSRAASETPTWFPETMTPPPEMTPRPVDLIEKAQKRREIEEKKAALIRQLAELEQLEV
ncbi:hypothetical protein M422DRAFT_236136 [Sphaerobolus stellatus SS14]|uniref:Uncharacterized protein n=1 Tax=Sphaerobolus stellatus (strain SS14) TaxID=990650 RepID=A0A0C9TDW0_SPHS4|nr:hypothetical protein M422DRAFT_236136 [Sphaerobolus stellatus SS14]